MNGYISRSQTYQRLSRPVQAYLGRLTAQSTGGYGRDPELGNRSLLQRAAIVGRRHSGDTSEDAGQMMLVGKAARQRHAGQRCAVVAHQDLRPLHAPVK